jgi:hypothetical protein
MKNSNCEFCHGNGFVTKNIFHEVWTPYNVSSGGCTVVETIAVRCGNCDAPWLTATNRPGVQE